MFRGNVGQYELDGLALQIEDRFLPFTDAEYGETDVTGSSRTSFSFRYHGDDYLAFPLLEGNAANPRTYALSITHAESGFDPFYGHPLGNGLPTWTTSSLSEEHDPNTCRSFTAGTDYTDPNRDDDLEFWLGGTHSWALSLIHI